MRAGLLLPLWPLPLARGPNDRIWPIRAGGMTFLSRALVVSPPFFISDLREIFLISIIRCASFLCARCATNSVAVNWLMPVGSADLCSLPPLPGWNVRDLRGGRAEALEILDATERWVVIQKIAGSVRQVGENGHSIKVDLADREHRVQRARLDGPQEDRAPIVRPWRRFHNRRHKACKVPKEFSAAPRRREGSRVKTTDLIGGYAQTPSNEGLKKSFHGPCIFKQESHSAISKYFACIEDYQVERKKEDTVLPRKTQTTLRSSSNREILTRGTSHYPDLTIRLNGCRLP